MLMKKRTLLQASVIFVFACTTLKLAEPTEADVEKGKSTFPNLTLEDLKEGKKLYESNCNLCHKLYNPKTFTETDWKKIVPPMVKKVSKKTQQTLTEKEEQQILHYLLVARQK